VTDDALAVLLAEEVNGLGLAGCEFVTARGVGLLAAAANGDRRVRDTDPDAAAVAARLRFVGRAVVGQRPINGSALNGSLSRGGRLASLSLHGCVGVGNRAVKSLQRLGALERLNVSATHITAKGLRALLAGHHDATAPRLEGSNSASSTRSSGSSGQLPNSNCTGAVPRAPLPLLLRLPLLRVVNARCLPGCLPGAEVAAAVASLRAGVALRRAALGARGGGGWRVLGGELPEADVGAAECCAACGLDCEVSGGGPTVGGVPFHWPAVPRAGGACALAAWGGLRGLPGDAAAAVLQAMHPLAKTSFKSALLAGDGCRGRSDLHDATPTLVVDEEGLVVGGHVTNPSRRWERHATAPVVPRPRWPLGDKEATIWRGAGCGGSCG
jgi:hypothetical protein